MFTGIRRLILVILLVILIPHYIQNETSDWGKGNGDTIKALQKEGAVTTIPVDKSFPIDNDMFTADTVYVTPKQIMVTYEFHTNQKKGVWSFPVMSLKLVMPDGQELTSHNAGSSGTAWGSIGYVSFSLPDKLADRVKLVYEHYDRYREIEIPLGKAGEET
jgi:hypothetical protein